MRLSGVVEQGYTMLYGKSGMKKPNFREMSPEEFKAYCPVGPNDDAYEAEVRFRDWCEENEEDPQNKDARESYAEHQEENSWDNLDPDNREGYEDNMHKDD
jgi:hypothetical protein